MAVFALWSAPRARSTAFFRSMVERGDMTVLHEPFCNLRDYGETDAGPRTFASAASLLAWLRDETPDMRVFLKDHPPTAYVDEVLADRRFLAEARHAFLIRRPEEIAASSYALYPGMNVNSIGLETLSRVQAAVRAAGGDASVVIDSDDLVARPEATMAAYCAAVGLPFIPRALTWEPGERPEWRRSARWHMDVSASSGFERYERVYPHTVENSADLARFAAHHRPFYDRLYAQRLDVTPWEDDPVTLGGRERDRDEE
jgi:sulfotransferase family protein